MNMTLHAHTPIVVAVEPRGLAVRRIAQCRAEPNQATEKRITRKVYDVAGRLVSQCDPRLAHPNLRTIYNLNGRSLFTDSVDAGWRLILMGEADQVAAAWDGRGIQRQTRYDNQMRPVSIVEQGLVSERLAYGGPDDSEHNRCNQLIRHDDTAGTRYLPEYGLRGSPLTEARSFLLTAETPDWPLAEAERDALSESNRLETQWTFNALGETIKQTDALGHSQYLRHTVAGQLKAVELTLTAAAQPQTLVSDIHYNALDQVEEQTSGNGVISRAVYDPASGLLQSMTAGRAGHEILQSLHYGYDPVGNILHIEDTAQPVRFFANQRVEPVSRYTYDTLYQLIEATGREVNTGASHGPALPALQTLPPDPNRVSRYTQTYDYDTGGNLLQMRHVGAQSFTRTLHVAADSNRSLPEGEVEVDFDEAFDANGNLLHLVRGQTLDWDLRNQLRQITTVTRDDTASDNERYVYDGQGQRCRKITSAQTSSRTLSNEVRYLPGLEIRTTADGETLHVITAHNARVLHWQAGSPSGIENDQIRYSLNDHLGSSTLELDQHGGLISQESYYPFGGTSWWAARSTVEAKYKTIRYSGKERDASGLYYYGFRYYAPWLQRWINPDPAGDVDGLNLFCFVGNSPVTSFDLNGFITEQTENGQIWFADEGLQARLEKLQRQSPERDHLLKTRYIHQHENTYTIGSLYYHEDYECVDYFENKFMRHKWTFKKNFKHVRAEPVVHADEVAVEQYLRVSRAVGFSNALPSVIKRSLVINEGVMEVARKYASGSPQLMEAFLTSTQNGKSTQRLLNTFRLRPIRVETRFSGSSDLDVYIHVKPQELRVAEQDTLVDQLARLAAPEAEQPARNSRFSVTPVATPSASRFRVLPVDDDVLNKPDARRSSKGSGANR
ncbi:RHS repeat protein [Pseudomonas sp. R1-18]